MAMGSATLTYVVANLLYHFDWELPEGVRREDVCMEEEGGVTVHKKTPLILVPATARLN
uniref:Cytochrome P450 n=1 Tax=Kalanchoe fedtschenkoi TaxID=63787 RepID=A0A7N0ZZM7_KALFE